MIEMPPPKPPELEPSLLGKAIPENNLTELADGWKFTAQGLRDSYDRQYWR